MSNPNEAQKALQRLADKCWNSQSYEGDSSIGKDVTIIEQALRTASAQQVDKCPDCGSPMMDVCSGLEKFSREGCDHTDATVRLQDREINPP